MVRFARGSTLYWFEVSNTLGGNPFFNTYNLILAHINPNGWRMLLSLVVVNGEQRIELEDGKLWIMHWVKRNGVDEGRAYIEAIILRGLILKLHDNQPKWKDTYFYVGCDIWDVDPVVPLRST